MAMQLSTTKNWQLKVRMLLWQHVKWLEESPMRCEGGVPESKLQTWKMSRLVDPLWGITAGQLGRPGHVYIDSGGPEFLMGKKIKLIPSWVWVEQR